MLVLFCILIFFAVIFVSLGIITKRNSSTLLNKFTAPTVTKDTSFIEKVNFLDTLWGVNEALRLEALKTAGLIGTIGFVGGLMLTKWAGVFFALVGFTLAPRVRIFLETSHKKRLFFKQFPKAVSELAAITRSAGTGTMLTGFQTVQQEHPSPVADVFGYIAQAMETGSTPCEAVKSAQKQYDYPGLDKLATATQIISELGGGEKAVETLTASADHIRFLERFRGKVDAAISGIVQEMLFSSLIIIGYFLFSSGPWTEGWPLVVKHPTVVIVGFIAIIGGWFISWKKIQNFKNANYL